MFKRIHLIVEETDERVDHIARLAANHKLQCLYKIGVYGKERQHELYIIGAPWAFHAFKKELNPAKKK